jgi:hypothetical protein
VTTRRNFIKTTLISGASAAAVSASGFTILKSKPRLGDQVIGHRDFRYRVHQAWGNLDRAKTPVKNCHEMVLDSKGRLIMITDETRNNIIIYDKSGKLLKTWGTEFPGGHGLTLAKEGGEDFLFICDTTLSTVTKTTVDGKKIFQLDSPEKLGIYTKEMPYKPTESAVAPTGDIYVADGYGSQFIIQYNNKGEYIRHWGGKGDGDSQFDTAHGVAIDLRDKTNPTLLCTSRVHNSFKRFTLDGKYLATIFLPGAFVCRPVLDGENLYAGVCWSRLRYLNQTPNSGFVTILDKNNRVISNPGGTAPTYIKDELQLMVQETPLFKHCHDVCVDEDKNIYVCQWNADQAYPMKLERV